ncbi:nuclease-related domain-containing protein [Macrococcoides caseolyticum]|uniref:nuclease-related domain-containing protein n=1 Tax=Macrococcoides caseolyticum TaxID=69966 RepID=UPI001F37A5D3|nr:nuclease-related domain-containing protein [Macrococcus caseolyticus]MCE4957241.1 NERD domain-containing protein [Macrococcus caseolyticus]
MKPIELMYLEEVHGRTQMLESDRRKYYNLKIGYAGEKKVYDYLNQFNAGVCIWDIRLDIRGEIQYDFFVIVNGTIFILEIKNYYGNYTYKDGNLISESGFVSRDVFSQASNARDKFEAFCYEHSIQYKIVNEVIFVNDDFKVMNEVDSVKFHSMYAIEQLARYMCNYETTHEDREIGQLIVNHHIEKSKNEQINYYPYDVMKRGLKCPECQRFIKIERSAKRQIVCCCGHKMSKSEAICEAFKKIELLKRDYVTASEVREWVDCNPSGIRKILGEKYKKIGSYKNRKYRSSYF